MDRYLKEERIIENLENRNLKEAFSLIEDYHSLYGKTDFYYLALSDYYIFNHEYNKVIKLLNQALESGLESNEVYERLADAYFGLERYDIVLEYIEKCDLVQDNPNYIRLFELGGFCNFKLGNYKEAIQYYEDVLMEDQNSFPAYLFGGISYYMMGDKETGIHYLAKVLHQCDERTMYSLSGIVSDLNRLDLIEDMETIIPDVHKHFIHYMKGYYYVNANQLKEAISQFRMFLRKVDSYEISIELAKLYHYTEDEQRCQDILHDLYDGLPPMEDVPFYEENILFLLEMISYIDLKREEKSETIKKWLNALSHNLLIVEDLFEFSIENNFDAISSEIMANHENALEISIRFQYLRVIYYVERKNYKKALGYLLIMDNQENEYIYKKYLVTVLFFLQEFNKVVDLGYELLPDGRIGMMMVGAYNELHKQEQADAVIEYMAKFKNQEYTDKDLYLEFLEKMGGIA